MKVYQNPFPLLIFLIFSLRSYHPITIAGIASNIFEKKTNQITKRYWIVETGRYSISERDKSYNNHPFKKGERYKVLAKKLQK